MSDMRIDEQIAALAASQHGVVSMEQATARGATRALVRQRLRTGRWLRVMPHVLGFAGAPDTWRRRLTAAVLEAGPGAAVSHRAAAALLGIPGFPEGPVEVTQWRGRHHLVPGAVVHETSWLPESHVTVIDGVRCTSLARTNFDLAATEHPKRAERAFDNSLHQLGLTIGKAADVLAALGRRGRAGTALMREMLEKRGPGYVPPASELEALYVAVAEAFALPRADRQVRLGGNDLVGRVDFYYRAAKLVVEADSRRHHDSLLDREADSRRRGELAAAGWRLIPVTWWQLVHEPEVVSATIRRALQVVPA